MSFAFCINSCTTSKYGINNLRTYNDTVSNFSVQYPQNWFVQQLSGQRFAAYSSQNVIQRFRQYDYSGPAGARIDIIVVEPRGKDKFQIASSIAAFDENIYSKELIFINNVEVLKLEYSFVINEGTFYGNTYVFQTDDDPATILRLEAFDKKPENYLPLFKLIVNKLIPGKRQEPVLAEPPSTNFKNVIGEGFTIGIPTNFSLESKAKTPNAIAAYTYSGKRRADSFIRVDIFEAARNVTIEKILEANLNYYNEPRQIEEFKIDEYNAVSFYYDASDIISGKVIFCLKDLRLYRIIINWYNDESHLFKNIFERSAKTFKFR